MAPAVMFHLGHRGKGKNTVGDVFNRFLSQRFCVAICIVFFYYYHLFFYTLSSATGLPLHLHLFHPIILVNRPVLSTPELYSHIAPRLHRRAICQVLLPTLARGFL